MAGVKLQGLTNQKRPPPFFLFKGCNSKMAGKGAFCAHPCGPNMHSITHSSQKNNHLAKLHGEWFGKIWSEHLLSPRSFQSLDLFQNLHRPESKSAIWSASFFCIWSVQFHVKICLMCFDHKTETKNSHETNQVARSVVKNWCPHCQRKQCFLSSLKEESS